MERNYTLVLSAATLLLAEELTRLEKRQERKRKKMNVLDRKRQMLREAIDALNARRTRIPWQGNRVLQFGIAGEGRWAAEETSEVV